MLNLQYWPAEILKTECKPVEYINDEILELVKQMGRCMSTARGLGLAAPQVGKSLRLFVMKTSEPPFYRVFINPEITDVSDEETVINEGCLSMPGLSWAVKRPTTITVSAHDEQGERFTLVNITGMDARCVLHEVDHLDGIMFIDPIRVGELSHKRALKKYRKVRKARQRRGE